MSETNVLDDAAAAPVEPTPDQPAAEPADAAAAEQPAGEQSAEEAQPAEAQPDGEQDGEQPGTEVARRGFLTIEPNQERLTPAQAATLGAIGITSDFHPGYVRWFMHFCQTRDLDMWQKEAYLIKRDTSRGPQYTIQTAIDTFRRRAFETGRFRRVVARLWTSDEDSADWWIVDKDTGVKRRVWVDAWVWPDKNPAAAKVIVEYYDEHGDIVTTEAVVNWEMFVGTTTYQGQKKPNAMWSKGGPHMLAKCGEALALRSAFPQRLGGLYIDEEMDHLRRDDAESLAEQVAKKRREARNEAERNAKARHAGPVVVDGTVVNAGTGEAAGGDGGQPASFEDAWQEPAEVDDREHLLTELHEQARITGTSVARLTNRLVAMHKAASFEALPVDALRTLVTGLRRLVAQRMRGLPGMAAQADEYEALPQIGMDGVADRLKTVPAPSEAA